MVNGKVRVETHSFCECAANREDLANVKRSAAEYVQSGGGARGYPPAE